MNHEKKKNIENARRRRKAKKRQWSRKKKTLLRELYEAEYALSRTPNKAYHAAVARRQAFKAAHFPEASNG